MSTDFVAPVDRIRLWNIGPGDRVRILRGEDEDKYVDPKLGKRGGWKIYTVERIDQKKSRVYFFKTSVSCWLHISTSSICTPSASGREPWQES